MKLFLFLVAGAVMLLAADSKQQVFDLFTKIASELSADNPLVFLDSVDHDMPHYGDFQGAIVALTDQADITNSIETVSDTGDDMHRVEELDWFMQIVDKAESQHVEKRRQTVTFKLERRGKKWKIVSIDPISFFAPHL